MQMMENRNTERRLGMDRRCFSYDGCIPERRSGGERRSVRNHETGELIVLEVYQKNKKESSLYQSF